ncbi:MAG: hypothetical protein A2046_05580 [Bacteroidetes bacterium GWA2_30_7]|nr:MAG: hypothetical protein A2046_05580 [Bacteroidetes bacterium GWA2_30_7]
MLLLLFKNLDAQVAPNKYQIFFTDKNFNQYTLSNPSEFLSQKALDRRTKQNIAIDELDLPVSQYYIDSLKNMGLVVLNKSKWFNCITVQTTDMGLLNSLNSVSFVKSYSKKQSEINNNTVDNKFDFTLTNNPILKNTLMDYGSGANQIQMLNGHILHNLGFQGQGMTIAIIDAGYINSDTLLAFDSLRTNEQIIATKDFVDGDNNIYAHHDHGTMVFSIIGSNVSGQFIGTCPKANFILLRSEDTNSEYILEEFNWASAAEYADSLGVDVINTSLGYNTFTDPSQDYTYNDLDGNTTTIARAADLASSKGILVVVSAGNAGATSWHYITTPADADSVLTVGAVDAIGDYASISSTGPTPDGRIKPNIVAQGSGTTVYNQNGNLINGSGTSFAAPIITGLAACLWQAHPDLTNMQILEAIEKSASQFSNPDSLLGYGIPDFAVANLLLNNVSYNQVETENLVKLFPNPFFRDLTVEFYSVDSQNVKFELYNLLGNKILFANYKLNIYSYNKIKLNPAQNIASGIYVLRIISDTKTYERLIVKD